MPRLADRGGAAGPDLVRVIAQAYARPVPTRTVVRRAASVLALRSMTRFRSALALFSAILPLAAAFSFALVLATGVVESRRVQGGAAVMPMHHHGVDKATADRDGSAEHRHGSLPCRSACCGACLACMADCPGGASSLPVRGPAREVVFAMQDVRRQGIDPAGLRRPPRPSRLA